ncbi:hypothetical protein [Vagococcus acidifermentans]
MKPQLLMKIVLVQKKADIIDWRFRGYKGKVQKRKFNYSKNKWAANGNTFNLVKAKRI